MLEINGRHHLKTYLIHGVPCLCTLDCNPREMCFMYRGPDAQKLESCGIRRMNPDGFHTCVNHLPASLVKPYKYTKCMRIDRKIFLRDLQEKKIIRKSSRSKAHRDMMETVTRVSDYCYFEGTRAKAQKIRSQYSGAKSKGNSSIEGDYNEKNSTI